MVSEVGVPTCTVAAGKRLAMPAGALPPSSSFLAMPGGRLRPRPANPGGTTFDLPDEEGCGAVAGKALEMCIVTPVRLIRYAERVNDASTAPSPLISASGP